MIVFDDVTFTYPDTERPVFERLSLELPEGSVSLVGQNGTGKSTLLLLAGGRLLPDSGTVLINGRDTASFQSEEERAEYAAHIYQNVEFETEEKVEDLLSYVYENGFHSEKDPRFIDELVKHFELEKTRRFSPGRLSKGEHQRVILAFSLLYGSNHIMMDEPVFALEPYQKERAFSYLTEYARTRGVTIYYSAHELELTEKYSDHMLLFSKTAPPRLGPTRELFQREIIEEAYEVPFVMLKQRESIFREGLTKINEAQRPGRE
ncbi:MAG TPA: ABC transporter ATP-binding protein [Spirochaetia bacterium]|nr:ABC transporter ATP-binding protein [Spirochaetia bacterium]